MDDPVAKYIPAFENIQVATGVDDSRKPILEKSRRPMTIRDLTRHTSGLANSNDLPVVGPMLEKADPKNREHTLQQFVDKCSTIPLWFHPGEQWAYGPSVDFQARLVEILSGMKFDEYLNKHNDLTAVLFVQLRPFDKIGLHKNFRDAVYGPIK